MRSNLSTNNRILAHIIAVVLLILMLVYLAVPMKTENLLPPLPIPARTPQAKPAAPQPEPTAAQAGKQSQPDTSPRVADAPASQTADTDAGKPETSEPAPAQPVQTDESKTIQQPDESGSLVVAPSDTGETGPIPVMEPLANANLEVLGDGVYWLSPRHDLLKELAAIPEIETLILLSPDPDHRIDGLEHIKTVVIPANPDDLTGDAASLFEYLTSSGNAPVVAAALPNAKGAAFFKGAYFIAHRKAGIEEILADLQPELSEAGDQADGIIHRLRGLAQGEL